MPNNQDSTTPATVPNETKTLDIIPEVVNKINEAQNILVALSSDPSVDEMSAAIGLSLFLDRLGKRATAIYSGTTPNALEFLKPEETFESTADALQDFVIALNKEKADHLRYKLDGDFVKIYITPYKNRISEDDLNFSYGDFNVDLVLALDVANGIDLDSALREHGRIMHDAVIVNITTGNPGKFGEIEWSDKTASSISEMIAKLLYNFESKAKLEKEEATAFLTGIVASTNRFSNAKTTPDTMKISSRLMESGANQQLIAKNITPDTENEIFSMLSAPSLEPEKDATKLNIKHGNEEGTNEDAEIGTRISEKESTLLEDLKAAEASLSQAGAETTPEKITDPLKIDSTESANISSIDQTPAEPVIANAVTSEPVLTSSPEVANFVSDKPEKVLQPSENLLSGEPEGTSKYGQMLEEALANASSEPAPIPAPVPDPISTPVPEATTSPDVAPANFNPATMNAPAVPVNPEINGVPEINYMPMPGDEVLPPPPTPPIMASTEAPASIPEPAVEPISEPISEPASEPVATVIPEPSPEVATAPMVSGTPAPVSPSEQPVVDPGAFKIPGM